MNKKVIPFAPATCSARCAPASKSARRGAATRSARKGLCPLTEVIRRNCYLFNENRCPAECVGTGRARNAKLSDREGGAS